MSSLTSIYRTEYEAKVRVLASQVWGEIGWSEIDAWLNNFDGQVFDTENEQLYALLCLSRYMYFSKRLIREMLKSLYRDHFESPLLQRIRRNMGGTTDSKLLRKMYAKELEATRFVGVGNPAESGAHLLYYFRQVNYLPKDLFIDLSGAFTPSQNGTTGEMQLLARDGRITRYVFFDDLVGSATQASSYLSQNLKKIRNGNKDLDLRFMSLFATTNGLDKMNEQTLFGGNALCLFELDDTFKAFNTLSRYFLNSPAWFEIDKLLEMAKKYGEKLNPHWPLGYKDGQLMLGFTHNTPDNSLPIFWDEGQLVPWAPLFVRYDKKYGGKI